MAIPPLSGPMELLTATLPRERPFVSNENSFFVESMTKTAGAPTDPPSVPPSALLPPGGPHPGARVRTATGRPASPRPAINVHTAAKRIEETSNGKDEASTSRQAAIVPPPLAA